MGLLIVIFILLIIFILYITEADIKIKGKIQNEKQEKIEQEIMEQKKKIEEKIINSERFKEDLKKLEEFSRCFNLAGGLDPFLPCHYLKSKENEYQIILEKRGYDLFTLNLKEYYNNPAPLCYEALNRFAADLFGEYAEEMKNFISMEYIADHLIKIENIDNLETDFMLRFEFTVSCLPEWNYIGDIRDLYLKNIFRDNERH